MQEISKEAITAAVQQLTKAYVNPNGKTVEKAIQILKDSLRYEAKVIRPVRADRARIVKAHYAPLGVPWLDKWLSGGVRAGEFVLWVDVPGGSKTHAMKWIGSQFVRQGKDVIDISGEDLVSDTLDYYMKGVKSKEALKHLWIADMQEPFGVSDVEDVIEQVRKEGGDPQMVVVDHLDLMRQPFARDDVTGLKLLATELKFLFKREKVVGVSASQALFAAPGVKGMHRIYGSKVGKAGNMDVIFIVDSSDDELYTVTLAKARGRKRAEEKTKTLEMDWDNMIVREA